MFDIAFSELVVIAIVALIMIGPERLPKVARMLGALMGRMQKYMTQIKEEVNREARFAELQKLQEEIRSASSAAKLDLQSSTQHIHPSLQEVNLGTSDMAAEEKHAASKIQNETTPTKS